MKLSATNFLLLSQIVEKASGQSYHDFVTENQIRYLGLRRTMFREDFPLLDNEKITQENPRHSLFTKEGRFIDPAEPAAGNPPDAGRTGGDNSFSFRHDEGVCGYLGVCGRYQYLGYRSGRWCADWKTGKPGADLQADGALRTEKWFPAMAGWQFQHLRG